MASNERSGCEPVSARSTSPGLGVRRSSVAAAAASARASCRGSSVLSSETAAPPASSGTTRATSDSAAGPASGTRPAMVAAASASAFGSCRSIRAQSTAGAGHSRHVARGKAEVSPPNLPALAIVHVQIEQSAVRPAAPRWRPVPPWWSQRRPGRTRRTPGRQRRRRRRPTGRVGALAHGQKPPAKTAFEAWGASCLVPARRWWRRRSTGRRTAARAPACGRQRGPALRGRRAGAPAGGQPTRGLERRPEPDVRRNRIGSLDAVHGVDDGAVAVFDEGDDLVVELHRARPARQSRRSPSAAAGCPSPATGDAPSSCFRSWCRSATAMPRSVTTTSTVSPGVVTVVTWSRTIGRRPRIDGATTMASFAPAAVSRVPAGVVEQVGRSTRC